MRVEGVEPAAQGRGTWSGETDAITSGQQAIRNGWLYWGHMTMACSHLYCLWLPTHPTHLVRKASSSVGSSATPYCSPGPPACHLASHARATLPTTAAVPAAEVVAWHCRCRPARHPNDSRRSVPHSTWGHGGMQTCRQLEGDTRLPATLSLNFAQPSKRTQPLNMRTCALNPGLPSQTSTTRAKAKERRESTGASADRKSSNSCLGGKKGKVGGGRQRQASKSSNQCLEGTRRNVRGSQQRQARKF